MQTGFRQRLPAALHGQRTCRRTRNTPHGQQGKPVIAPDALFDAINPVDGTITIVDDHGLPGAHFAQTCAQCVFQARYTGFVPVGRYSPIALQLDDGEQE